MHCCGSDSGMTSFFIRVDTASEAVYELIAEPIQEPQARNRKPKQPSSQIQKSLTPLTCKTSPGA